MSVVTLDQVKRHLRVIHNDDDDLIQDLIDGAEDELKRYLDRDTLPRRDDSCPCDDECESDSDVASESDTAETVEDDHDVAPSIRVAVFFLVQAAYEGTPEEAAKLRQGAFYMSASYRCRQGA